MPTPKQYDKSRNKIRQEIREKLGMRVPESDSQSVIQKSKEETKPVDVQILEEIKAIKEILKKLLDK